MLTLLRTGEAKGVQIAINITSLTHEARQSLLWRRSREICETLVRQNILRLNFPGALLPNPVPTKRCETLYGVFGDVQVLVQYKALTKELNHL
jgi:hypothetical protein